MNTHRNVNFAPLGSSRYRRRSRKVWFIPLIIIAVLALIAGSTILWYYPKIQKAVAAGREAERVGRRLSDNLGQQKFDAAKADVVSLQAQLTIAQQSVDSMQGLRAWPYVGTQYKAVETLLDVGTDSVTAVGTFVDFLANIFKPFSGKGKISLASITPEQKGQLLEGIATRGPDLRSAQTALHHAEDTLQKLPQTGLVPQLAKIVSPMQEQFPAITEAVDQIIPATKVIPSILGYPTQKQYLFLLENNTELRPGGGFIGTYGIMKVRSGDIYSLKTDNVYNIDKNAKSLPTITPPAAMQRLLKVPTWYFRDSNWSPDFPTSAQQATYLYQREGGQKNLDGVVAITPTAIAHMIGLVGSIKVAGIEFNEENFVSQLQYQVEQGFLKAGIPEAQRKDIISTMTSELMNRIMNLPISEWKDLFLTINDQLESKQILLYMRDSVAQNVLVQENWAGAIATTVNEDYLMVTDANLASLKTDEVMERHYTYTVAQEKNGAVATLTIKYRNTGKFDWKTTRYNTYIRVYVPSGSVLLSSSGAQLRERSQTPGQVETLTELGKTVFAAFKSIEPGTESELVLKYTLPAGVAAQWQAGKYTMVWQKQPGMVRPTIDVTFNAPKAIGTFEGVDNKGKISKNSAQFEGLLDHDRTIIVHTK
jgi:hypothetical protein